MIMSGQVSSPASGGRGGNAPITLNWVDATAKTV